MVNALNVCLSACFRFFSQAVAYLKNQLKPVKKHLPNFGVKDQHSLASSLHLNHMISQILLLAGYNFVYIYISSSVSIGTKGDSRIQN